MKKQKIFIVLAFIIFLSSLSYSQIDTNRQEFRSKMEKVVKEKFKNKLKIDDKTTDDFFIVFKENRKAITDLNKQRRGILEYINGNPEASDIGSKLDDLISLEMRSAELKSTYYNNLKKILTPTQIAQAMVFQKNLQKFLKKEMKGKGKKGNKERNDRFDD